MWADGSKVQHRCRYRFIPAWWRRYLILSFSTRCSEHRGWLCREVNVPKVDSIEQTWERKKIFYFSFEWEQLPAPQCISILSAGLPCGVYALPRRTNVGYRATMEAFLVSSSVAQFVPPQRQTWSLKLLQRGFERTPHNNENAQRLKLL